jgi:hypothetical protein
MRTTWPPCGNTDCTAENTFPDRHAVAHISPAQTGREIDCDARFAVATTARRDGGLPLHENYPGSPVLDIAVNQLPRSRLFRRCVSRIAGATRALPAFGRYARSTLEHEFVAPRNEHERFIVSVWQDMRGFDRIGIDDNFFSPRGHSLIATGVAACIPRELKVNIRVRTDIGREEFGF